MTIQAAESLNLEQFGAELKTDAVIVKPEEAEAIALEKYGLEGRAEWLWGEKDSNYQLTLADGTHYLLKILNPGESPAVTRFHSQALLEVEQQDAGIPLQRVIRNLDGEADFRITDSAGQERSVRVVTFVPGSAQTDSEHSSTQRYNAGRMLARLQLALQGFKYDSLLPPIIWDMQHSATMREFLPLVDDLTMRTRLESAIDTFESDIVPVMGDLPTQVIHNDFNPNNILIDETSPEDICGIIDFGDMVKAPALFDLAVAVSYQIGTDENWLDEACDCLKGYASLKQLTPMEIDLLYPAIIMRIVMRYTIAAWRSSIFPDQREHLTRYWPTLRTQLELIEAVGRENATARFAEIFSKEKQ